MELANLSLAFSAGLLAVLAPCALPMLPSFVSFFMNSEEKKTSVVSAVGFGITTVAGFLTVFLAIGILPSFAVNVVASKISLVSPFIGVILVILGLGHLFTDVFYNLPVLKTAAPEGRGFKAFYLYGLGYGAASMACSFPVFVLLVLQSATAGGFVSILAMFLAYGLGSATILVPLTLALTFSREIIYQRLMAVLPHMKKINAAILILAGAYMIYYGLA
jgi:cytochrome c biogenesis protein CcdA